MFEKAQVPPIVQTLPGPFENVLNFQALVVQRGRLFLDQNRSCHTSKIIISVMEDWGTDVNSLITR